MIQFSPPLLGMTRAEEMLDRAASRIADWGGSEIGDTVDLSTEVVALMESRNLYAANAKAFRTEDEISKTLLDVLG